jgi:hypothetical protein
MPLMKNAASSNKIGDLTQLETTEKSNLVGSVNEINQNLSEHKAETTIQVAGGTANAIVITTSQGNYSYGQFKKLSFKTNVDNRDVTINVDGLGAVPALKFDGSQLPAGAIKAGKVYDWYYDTSSGGRFFLIAKASGTAVAEDVLAGETFSNDNGEFTGNIPNNGTGGTTTPGTSDIVKPAGYYSSPITIKGDPDKTPGNIKAGVVSDDVLGTYDNAYKVSAGTNIINSNTPAVGSGNAITTPTKVKETQVVIGGTYRVVFSLFGSNTNAVYGRIYINGIAKGIQRQTGSTTSTIFTEDITVNPNDLIQIYSWTNGVTNNAYVQNFYLESSNYLFINKM